MLKKPKTSLTIIFWYPQDNAESNFSRYHTSEPKSLFRGASASKKKQTQVYKLEQISKRLKNSPLKEFLIFAPI